MNTNTKLLIPLIAAGALLAACNHRDDNANGTGNDSATPTSPSGAGDQSTTPGGNAGDTSTTPGTPTSPDTAAPPPADSTTPPADSTTQPSNPPPQQ